MLADGPKFRGFTPAAMVHSGRVKYGTVKFSAVVSSILGVGNDN